MNELKWCLLNVVHWVIFDNGTRNNALKQGTFFITVKKYVSLHALHCYCNNQTGQKSFRLQLQTPTQPQMSSVPDCNVKVICPRVAASFILTAAELSTYVVKSTSVELNRLSRCITLISACKNLAFSLGVLARKFLMGAKANTLQTIWQQYKLPAKEMSCHIFFLKIRCYFGCV